MPPTHGGGRAIIRDNPNWRRYRHACIYYRERWSAGDDDSPDGQSLLYQIICLQNTPPLDQAEQDRCMSTRKVCWRLKGMRAQAAASTPPPAAESAEVAP